MPDDFEAEQDLALLTAADKIRQDRRRVARAARFAERRAEELKEQAEKVAGPKRQTPFNGTPRETSFKPKRK